MKRAAQLKKLWSTDQLITGIETPEWLKLLGKNGWNVSPQYAHRAAWITAFSLPSTVFGRIEDATWGRKLAGKDIDPVPLFVLGHWRSGTTHLHNLLGRDPQHTYSTVYQCVFPTSFLTTSGFVPQLTARFLDDTRSYDNVKQGWNEAAEDEIAMAKLTGMSPYLSFMFPDQAATYEKYIDFVSTTESEREAWQDAFRWFLKKIMAQAGDKRVIVKSCTHTARIRMLLDMFPTAPFVFIHRHPYEVFSSTLHMRSHTDWENFFQVPFENWDEERERQTLLLGQRIFERYLEDRHLIPAENLVELRYEDVCGNEREVMRSVYERLRLPGWAQAEKSLDGYVTGLKGYKRNQLKIDQRQKDLVYEMWRPVFDTFGYDREYKV